jgi:predicted permease
MLNLRMALRTMAKTPFVSGVAILSLALGIGANSAIFSLFNQMILRNLPVADPDRLVNLSSPGPKQGSTSCGQAGGCEYVFSYPMFRDVERVQAVFAGIAAHNLFDANLAFRGQTLNAQALLVSGSYFPVLGVQPALGRLLGPGDDTKPGGDFVVVLDYDHWRTRLGASPEVLNQPLVVNGHALTVVGVAPRGFQGVTLGARPQVYVPISMRELMLPRWKGLENRRSYWAYLFARLKPGMSIERTQSDINVPYHAILNEVEAPLQRGMSEATLARFKARTIALEPGARGQSSLHGEARPPLLLLMAVTGVVLLIACANIANLLLARAANRATEMAVRLSIGASRTRIVVQLLTESVLLALLGGAAGLVVGRWTLDLIAAALPAEATENLAFEIDGPVLLFAAALSIGTGVLFGLFPAMHSTRPDLVSTLKGNTGQPSGARAAARFRTILATVQIALSMTLLISAGLFAKSLLNVSRVDLGLNTEKLVVFEISPALNGYTPERSRALFERVEDELGALPGVTGVAASMVPLMSGSNWGSNVTVQGFQAGPDVDTHSMFNEVGPGYFRTLGIPLVAGREFTRADRLGAPRVAIVNEAFASKFNLGRDAVGRRMRVGGGRELDIEIVGLTQDAKYSEVKREIPPVFATPFRQDADLGSINFYVRTTLDERQLLSTISGVIRRLDPDLPANDMRTMDAQIRENVFLDRFISSMSAAFAGLATLLAAVGLYGVLTYTVAQRTREIGLRMALGANAAKVRGMVLGQVARMTFVGGVIGLAAALALGRWAQSLLFEIGGHDPAVLAGAACLLAIVALGAGFVPAYRASRLDPIRALRYE